jgi:DNA gyrase subunit A
MGRATQGVTLIGLDDGAKLSGLQRIVENDAIVQDENDENLADDESGGEDSGSSE